MGERLPLYLGGDASVRLDDGPSLVASRPGMAPLRVPLERCSRIVAQADTKVESDALLACMRHGVPLVWLDQGGPLALCAPAQSRALDWPELLWTAMAHPDWKTRYESWLGAQRAMALRSLGARHGFEGFPAHEQRWWAGFWARTGVRARWARWAMRRWEAMGVSLMLEFWVREGISPEAVCEPAAGWYPALDMGRCIALDMADELARLPDRWRRIRAMPAGEVHKALARAFEHRRGRLLRIACRIHMRFHRWLLGMQRWR